MLMPLQWHLASAYLIIRKNEDAPPMTFSKRPSEDADVFPITFS